MGVWAGGYLRAIETDTRDYHASACKLRHEKQYSLVRSFPAGESGKCPNSGKRGVRGSVKEKWFENYIKIIFGFRFVIY